MIQAQLKEVGIDYPRPGETIVPGSYTFRLSAPMDAKEVRLSIDDGPWQQCRETDGNWWYDWSGADQGQHIAVSRVIPQDDVPVVRQPRVFKIEPLQ